MLAAITPGFLTGGSAAKTYADFLAYITAQASSVSWTSGFAASASFRTIVGAKTGNMWGSPELGNSPADNGVYSGSAHSRIVQHALPSEATLDALVGKEVYCRVVPIGVRTDWLAHDRNGYLSLGQTTAGDSCANIDLCAWWDATAGSAFQRNPLLGTGPTPYPIP